MGHWMPVLMLDPELRHKSRPISSHFAILAATRALEAAYPLLLGEVLTDRQSQALAALTQAKPIATFEGTAKAVSSSVKSSRSRFCQIALHPRLTSADWRYDAF